MPVIERVLSRLGLGRKADVPIINDGRGNLPTVRVVRGVGLGAASWTGADYNGLASSGYQLNSDVYACISLIAGAGKQVKWWDGAGASKSLATPAELYKALGHDADDLPVGGDEAKRARHVKAAINPRASVDLLNKAGGAAFIEAWLSYLLISGNNYVEIERTGDAIAGKPSMLFLQRPDRVTAHVRPAGSIAAQASEQQLIDYWVVSAYAQRRDVPPANIVHSKLFNPTDDIYGMAPLQAALLRVDAENEGLTLIKRMLQRGFSPGWIEAAKDSQWDEPQVAQLKERIRGSKQLGEELFLENATWHQMGFSPTDSGVTEQQILSKRDIASVFHVPSQLIGDVASQTYANWLEARRALYMEAVIPLLKQFKDDWNRTIGAALGSPLDFDRDSFDAITAARQEATDRVVKLFTSGLITQAEGRSDLEYGEAKPGDTFYAPANLMPLDRTGA
jgi:HK97 family phage portal protein